MLNKRGQLTLFVIIGVAIIATIGILMLLSSLNIINIPNPFAEKNPQVIIENCISEELQEAEALSIAGGGYIGTPIPGGISDTDTGRKAPFYCHTDMLDSSCEVLEPLILTFMADEIENYLDQRIDECFKKTEKRNKVEIDPEKEVDLMIEPEILRLKIRKRITLLKGADSQSIDEFNIVINSHLYQYAYITNKIVNEEVNCDCNIDSCMADLTKIFSENRKYGFEFDLVNNDDGRIYIIKDTISNQEFNFGVRNCVR